MPKGENSECQTCCELTPYSNLGFRQSVQPETAWTLCTVVTFRLCLLLYLCDFKNEGHLHTEVVSTSWRLGLTQEENGERKGQRVCRWAEAWHTDMLLNPVRVLVKFVNCLPNQSSNYRALMADNLGLSHRRYREHLIAVLWHPRAHLAKGRGGGGKEREYRSFENAAI